MGVYRVEAGLVRPISRPTLPSQAVMSRVGAGECSHSCLSVCPSASLPKMPVACFPLAASFALNEALCLVSANLEVVVAFVLVFAEWALGFSGGRGCIWFDM